MNAADIMTRHVTTISPRAPVAEALKLMLKHRVSGLPVVDASGLLVGILTEGDLLRRVELGTEKHRSPWLVFLRGAGKLAEDYVRCHGRLVQELMTADVVAAPETASLREIVELMERKHVKRVPIAVDGRLLGVVSRSDLLRALAAELDKVQQPPMTDHEIRNRLRAELADQPWSRGNRLDVHVLDGVVVLEGCIFDERDRQAIRVAAENVPGVREVKDHLEYLNPALTAPYGV